MGKSPAKAKGKPRAKRKESAELLAARELFKPFLDRNPSASISEVGRESKLRLIHRPWGDPSVIFLIPEDPAPLANALNKLILPDRLSAIYHADKNWLEVIFTAYRLPDELQEVIGRKFKFIFGDAEYPCEFTDSSDELLALAKETGYFQATTTGFRNLQSYSAYARRDPAKQTAKPSRTVKS